MPEDEYNSIAKRAMLEDDFIVDDNGESGYGRGLEDWDHGQEEEEEEEEEEKASKKKRKKSIKLSSLFSNQIKAQKASLVERKVGILMFRDLISDDRSNWTQQKKASWIPSLENLIKRRMCEQRRN